MCVKVTCDRCLKPTFKGCGGHIEQVLANVPPSKRCKCGTKACRPCSGMPEDDPKPPLSGASIPGVLFLVIVVGAAWWLTGGKK